MVTGKEEMESATLFGENKGWGTSFDIRRVTARI